MNTTFFNSINNWDDFDNKLSNLNNKEKGNTFELLTKCYFKIKPQYNHYDDVWLLDEVPQKELDYLKIPSQDLGIDLIAKEGKEYYAIQCKYHGDKNQNITYKEVSTFLQQVESNKRITMGYICSSANGTSKNYQKVQKKEIQEILADSWQLLDKVFFDNVRKLLNNKAVKENPFKPRKHQKKAVKQALNHFVKENNSRGKLIFPCGAGKSLTGYWLSEALESKSTLIAVPSLSLVKQTLEVYLREIVANGIKVKWLCICSDEGIGTSDDVAIMTNNIGVPCKTDPEYIRAWLKENKDEHKIIFTTYQSGHLIADISKKLKLSFDLGIFDEAHKTVGSNLKKFSYLLFEKNINIDKRIFMTATERFYSGSKEDIISMDDEDVYGDTFAQMSFKEAIDFDLLTDYKVITIDIKKSEIADFIRDNNLVKLNSKWKKETDARSLASMLAMRKAMKQFNIKNVVSFHSSIEKAKRNKELQEYITNTYNYKPIDTYTVSGKIPTTKRNIIVQEFAKSDRALITNARCLTEGIDVPNIDCIVFADARKSKVDIVQALGRALRKKKGKEWGYVILPVVYDGDTNEIDNDNFNEIINIVRGLAANDERIVEYFKDKAIKGKGSGEMIKGSDIFSLDSSMLEEKDLASQLQIKIWEKLSKFEWMPFEEAKDFAIGLKLTSMSKWQSYCRLGKRPYNIPANPSQIYKDSGWVSWGDWLGTGRIADQLKEFLSFQEAKKIALGLNFKSKSEWDVFTKSNKFPNNIPKSPSGVYRNEGWDGWPDFLGNSLNRKNRKWVSYKQAEKYARKLKFNSGSDWIKHCRTDLKPLNIPSKPNEVYKENGWVDMGTFLGTFRVQSQKIVWPTFSECKKVAQDLKLKSNKDWVKYCRKNNNRQLPITPDRIYKDKGWNGWPDFLGKENILTYNEAKNYLKNYKLHQIKGYRAAIKNGIIKNLPINAQNFYKNKGWVSWGDYLSSDIPVRKRNTEWMPYAKARKYLKKFNIKYVSEYHKLFDDNKIPEKLNIPKYPQRVYENKGWISFSAYVSSKMLSPQEKKDIFYDYKNARKFVSKLHLKNSQAWRDYCKSGKRPNFIPSNPHLTYKNNGWQGIQHFLGNA